ncbi:hypothetical protein [Polymorphobacter megasporae]|uniref:hypothetical protein n=1 Tax=Glacieibacterium megasporae TaxID=2835787 RepID=UPI001C1E096F|nr:hypothetical protein [Polymorphobacter megasporae]UAJ10521.1 hypothetical protein KTC28_01780 [Polymorphobacter megasporae]
MKVVLPDEICDSFGVVRAFDNAIWDVVRGAIDRVGEMIGHVGWSNILETRVNGERRSRLKLRFALEC